MKVYLASSFRYINEVKELQSYLYSKGHIVSCEWWKTDYKLELKTQTIAEWFASPIIKVIYRRSLDAIRESRLLIFVTPEATKFNGANVEVGIALALDKPVIAFGQLEKSGMYEPVIRCATILDLELALKEFEI